MRIRAISLAWLAALAIASSQSFAQSIPPEPQPAKPKIVKPERVVIDDVAYGAYVGTSIPLAARVWLTGEAEPTVEVRVYWATSNSAVAWVSDAGTVMFSKPGKVTVKARAGTITAERRFEVMENPTRSLVLSDIEKDVRVGDTVKVSARVIDKRDAPITDARVNYAIVAPRGRGQAPRARMSPEGVFVAEDPGTYTILAEIAGFADRRQIRVLPAAGIAVTSRKRTRQADDEKVKFEDIDYTPYVGTSFALAPMLYRKGRDPVLNTDVTWTIDNPEVASVSPDGVVSFLKSGRATVTADDGVFQLTRKFTVQGNPSAKLVLAVNADDMRVGDSVKVNVQIWARGGMPVKDARPNFAILSEGVRTRKATITEDGMFTAEEPGFYTIIAEIAGLADKATIAVRPRDR